MARRAGRRRVGMGSVEVPGLSELQDALRELDRSVELNVLRTAGKRAMDHIAEEARRLVPVQTGALKASIKVKSRLQRSVQRDAATGKWSSAKGAKGRVNVAVVAGGKGAFHAHLVERGTVKMAAQPFMRPAFDAKHNIAVGTIGEEIARAIDEVKAKAARKAARAAKRAAS